MKKGFGIVNVEGPFAGSSGGDDVAVVCVCEIIVSAIIQPNSWNEMKRDGMRPSVLVSILKFLD